MKGFTRTYPRARKRAATDEKERTSTVKLGTRGQYAVMALADLARQKPSKPVALGEISHRQHLSITYLEQLFIKLRKNGLVKSVRGQGGGYLLAQPAGHITINQIIQAVEEPIQMTRCNQHPTKSCQGKKTLCLTHHLWEGLSHHIANYLGSVTLEDLSTAPQKSQEQTKTNLSQEHLFFSTEHHIQTRRTFEG